MKKILFASVAVIALTAIAGFQYYQSHERTMSGTQQAEEVMALIETSRQEMQSAAMDIRGTNATVLAELPAVDPKTNEAIIVAEADIASQLNELAPAGLAGLAPDNIMPTSKNTFFMGTPELNMAACQATIKKLAPDADTAAKNGVQAIMVNGMPADFRQNEPSKLAALCGEQNRLTLELQRTQ